jgi:hypothetical protein
VKLADKRAADKAAHIARDRESRDREDVGVTDDDVLTETKRGENHSEGQA